MIKMAGIIRNIRRMSLNKTYFVPDYRWLCLFFRILAEGNALDYESKLSGTEYTLDFFFDNKKVDPENNQWL